MKSNELRIGNYILVSNPNSEFVEIREETVEKCNHYHLKDISINDEDWVFNPIPITTKMLLRLGFKKKKNGVFYKEFVYLNTFSDDEKFGCAFVGLPKWIDLYYLHQLQNLYFALTGQELELKH